MPNEYINPQTKITGKNNVVYEIHYNWMGVDRGMGKGEGGYTIHFVEESNTDEGRLRAIEGALDDSLTYYSQEAIEKMDAPPINSLCTKHLDGWEGLAKTRNLGKPRGIDNSKNQIMRTEKRTNKMENALDYLEDLGF